MIGGPLVFQIWIPLGSPLVIAFQKPRLPEKPVLHNSTKMGVVGSNVDDCGQGERRSHMRTKQTRGEENRYYLRTAL